MIESIEGVEIVSVVGIPDPKVSNLAAAIIVKRQGYENLAEHDISEILAEKLPPAKQLYGGIYFIEEMPISVNGKILKRIVREIAITRYKNRTNSA